jgi:glycosyltransferase involved in cell wall biosynthesis
MPSNRLYYQLKPYLPWRFRMALRRVVARWKRKSCANVWPINEAAGRQPAGWPGWPDGKRFAFLITHDVEGSEGLAKCRQLMELEMQMGFRSSFNFIPEGEYSVSREFRKELQENGFEVGVQDLKHDGMLFQNREAFRQGAKQINRYMHDWGAVGFRSAFMFHNLEWAHDLDIDYSSCTFDTDPFEPQPDDVGTIFPFWVPAVAAGSSKFEVRRSMFDVNSSPSSEIRNRKSEIGNQGSVPPSPLVTRHSSPAGGYVELPYTMPQDSTLFFVLREKTTDIWKKKLDWIVQRGGMALVNVHPDYLGFNKHDRHSAEYPAAWYEAFLHYIRDRYGNEFWNVPPREVARWYKNNCDPKPVLASGAGTNQIAANVPPAANGKPSLAGKNVGVVLFSNYLSDPRPRREAEILARHGADVQVICLRANDDEPKCETVNGVSIRRLPMRRQRGGKSNYIYQYSAFTFAAFALLTAGCFRRRYHLIHVHNMPDVLVFSALLPKLLGAKVILDLHDPMPELMLTIFKLPPESFSVRMLKRLEKWSAAFANVVLTVNQASKRIYSSRSCAPEKIQVVMNSPNEDIFQFRPPAATNERSNGHFTIMYHGSLLQRNGFDLAVRALETVRKTIPGTSLLVCGERTPFFDSVMSSAGQRGLNGAIQYLGMKKPDQIAGTIDDCDLGIIPNHRNIFTEMNTPTRIFEYLSRGKPVVTPRAPGIQDYFGDRDLIYFELGDAGDLARKIEYAYFHPAEARDIVERGQKIYLNHRWSQESLGFVDTVAGLLGRR